MLFSAVCSCMWVCAELTEQLWCRLQVKDESSPMGRHLSLMGWHIWEERQRDTEGEPGDNRQQTHSYTVEAWPCWRGDSSLTSPARPIPAHMGWSSPPSQQEKGYDATYDRQSTQSFSGNLHHIWCIILPVSLVTQWYTCYLMMKTSEHVQQLNDHSKRYIKRDAKHWWGVQRFWNSFSKEFLGCKIQTIIYYYNIILIIFYSKSTLCSG